jgi:hypothetical protein
MPLSLQTAIDPLSLPPAGTPIVVIDLRADGSQRVIEQECAIVNSVTLPNIDVDIAYGLIISGTFGIYDLASAIAALTAPGQTRESWALEDVQAYLTALPKCGSAYR